jgi:hypothetical protein
MSLNIPSVVGGAKFNLLSFKFNALNFKFNVLNFDGGGMDLTPALPGVKFV